MENKESGLEENQQKVYIITGASSDVGIAYLKDLEKHNTEKVIAFCQYYSSDAKLAELKEEFANVDIYTFKCDLSKQEQVEAWIKNIKDARVTPTHILHLAADKFDYMRLKNFDWNKTVHELNIQVNTLGQLFKAFLPSMSKAKYGKVAVMLSSVTLGVPSKFMSDYVVTKYALLGLMKSAAAEYAGTGITINGLSPNMLNTKFWADVDPRMLEIYERQSSMQRNINLEEVVAGLRFLLSDESSYMNGVNINMSGGDRM